MKINESTNLNTLIDVSNMNAEKAQITELKANEIKIESLNSEGLTNIIERRN